MINHSWFLRCNTLVCQSLICFLTELLYVSVSCVRVKDEQKHVRRDAYLTHDDERVQKRSFKDGLRDLRGMLVPQGVDSN